MTYYLNVYHIADHPIKDYIIWDWYATKKDAFDARYTNRAYIYKKTISVQISPNYIDDKTLAIQFPNIKFHDYGWSRYL